MPRGFIQQALPHHLCLAETLFETDGMAFRVFVQGGDETAGVGNDPHLAALHYRGQISNATYLRTLPSYFSVYAQKVWLHVIPAKAGIQKFFSGILDSRLRGNDEKTGRSL